MLCLVVLPLLALTFALYYVRGDSPHLRGFLTNLPHYTKWAIPVLLLFLIVKCFTEEQEDWQMNLWSLLGPGQDANPKPSGPECDTLSLCQSLQKLIYRMRRIGKYISPCGLIHVNFQLKLDSFHRARMVNVCRDQLDFSYMLYNM